MSSHIVLTAYLELLNSTVCCSHVESGIEIWLASYISRAVIGIEMER